MKYAAWMGLIAAACIATPAHAVEEQVALLKNVTGQVQIVRVGATVEAKAGAPLYVADKLISSPNASAGITFKDGTLITLGASAELLVRDYVFEPKDAKYAFSVYLAKGTAIYSSGKIGKVAPESVKVDSPLATVGVRGTRFIIQAE